MQIHRRRQLRERVRGRNSEEPAVRVAAAIKTSVTCQNLRRVKTGIEGNRKQLPVRGRVGFRLENFPRLEKVFIHARAEFRQRTAREEKGERHGASAKIGKMDLPSVLGGERS